MEDCEQELEGEDSPDEERDGLQSDSIPSVLPDAIFRRPAQVAKVTGAQPGAPPIRRREAARLASVLRRGALVDKYQIEEVLGVGGFAVVYRAIHMLLRNSVALKLLRQDVLLRQPEMRAHLLEEAQLAARINHPNVVRIYDVTHTEQITYIVMEFIEGASLARRLDHGPLDVVSTLRMGLEVAAGLRAGLQQDLIHRDVKPANILFGRDGVAKLVDFGMAHERSRAEGSALPERPRVVGTQGYMAPEQTVDSTRVDFRADIYSLGVTLHEAATGERRRGQAPTPVIELPGAFLDLVRRMRSAAPDERPQSYDGLIRDMRQTLVAVGQPADLS